MADPKGEQYSISGQPRATITDFDPPKKPKKNVFAIACAVLASMTSILLGYDFGVMSGAASFIQEDLKLSDVQIEIMNGIICFYSLVGSFAAGRTSDWIGRCYTVVLGCAIFFAGALLMGFATNFSFLMFGHFVAGVGCGCALVIAPVYTAELSPASSRGFLASFPEVFINIGILLSYVSNYSFSKLPTRLGWRFMLGVGAIPSAMLAVGVLSMPESPRWLVMQGRLGEAKRVLDKTSDTPEEARLRLDNIKQAAGIPQACTDDVVRVTKRSHGEGVWKDLLLHPTPSVRHILIAAVGIHFLQQMSGINVVVLYTPRIFKMAGIKSSDNQLLATVAFGLVKTSFILVATFLLDRIGRRMLLLSSVGGMIVTLGCLSLGLTFIDHSRGKVMWVTILCIVLVLAYVAFFSIGLGPVTWVYSSEIFPLKLRAQGMSIAVAVSTFTNGTLLMTFISLYKAITIGGAFFLFTGVAAVAWVFFYTMLPETRGRTLEEIEVLFGKYCKWRSTNAILAKTSEDDKNKEVVHVDGSIKRIRYS
ncbi:hypothetical protein UlMin_026211 [Ulmus minor]